MKPSLISLSSALGWQILKCHQRWMCYEMASQDLLYKKVECRPSTQTTILKEETLDFQTMLLQQVCVDIETVVTRPSWVKCFSVLYKPLNAFVIKASDGLDSVFAKIT